MRSNIEPEKLARLETRLRDALTSPLTDEELRVAEQELALSRARQAEARRTNPLARLIEGSRVSRQRV